MKLYAQIKLQILYIQEGEFTNKDTKETIKYYQVLFVLLLFRSVQTD